MSITKLCFENKNSNLETKLDFGKGIRWFYVSIEVVQAKNRYPWSYTTFGCLIGHNLWYRSFSNNIQHIGILLHTLVSIVRVGFPEGTVDQLKEMPC